MDIISPSTIELTSGYIKSASQTYNFTRTKIKPRTALAGGVSLASKVPPLSFYFDRPRLQECFYESHRNEKTEKDCMQILRTSGTLICGKVITKNEHGVFIKVLFLRKEVSPSDASKKRWDSIAENVSDYDSCKVFCKKQDMADNFEGDNIKQNTVV